MIARRLFVGALLIASLAGGCDLPNPPDAEPVATSVERIKPTPSTNRRMTIPRTAPIAGPAPAPPREGEQTFTLRGVVHAVDRSKNEVTIAHEAMPGFMGAMVMPFTVRDPAILDDVQVNDIVYGPMAVHFERGTIRDYRLEDLTVTGFATPKGGESTPPTASFAKSDPLKEGDIVPDFAVTTQEGQTLRLSDLRGKVVALTFIYTRCPLPDFCPAVDTKFAELTRLVTANSARSARVQLLSVSFDPKHDTPEVLRAHAARRGAAPPWLFAVADTTELARVGPLLGLDYYPDRDEFAHNLATAVIGPDGRLVRLELGRKWTPADLARTMIAAIPRDKQPAQP